MVCAGVTSAKVLVKKEEAPTAVVNRKHVPHLKEGNTT